MVKKVAEKNEEEVRNFIKFSEKGAALTPISPQKALGLMVDAKMGRSGYLKVRNSASTSNANIFPSYDKVQAAKAECYPPSEAITITEVSAVQRLIFKV